MQTLLEQLASIEAKLDTLIKVVEDANAALDASEEARRG